MSILLLMCFKWRRIYSAVNELLLNYFVALNIGVKVNILKILSKK